MSRRQLRNVSFDASLDGGLNPSAIRSCRIKTVANNRIVSAFICEMHRQKLTKQDFAAKIGISPSYLTYLFNGKRGIEVTRIHGWCQALSMPEEQTRQLLLAAVEMLLGPDAFKLVQGGILK